MHRNTYWDIPTRLFHWSLVIFILLQWYLSEEGEMDLHYQFGLAVLSLVLFRILWGIVGPENVRFSSFIFSPPQLIHYMRTFLRRPAPRYSGHNPLGGLSVLGMLTVLLLQTVTGLFANDDILFDGPLSHWVDKETSDFLTGLHSDLFDLLLVFIGLHIAAIIFYRLYKKQNLTRPMIWSKEKASDSTTRVIRWGYAVFGILLFALCYLVVVSYLGGSSGGF